MIIHIGHKTPNLIFNQNLGRGEVPQITSNSVPPRINQSLRQGSDIYRSSKHVSALWGT